MFRINEVICINNIRYRILADLGDVIIWISLDDETEFPSEVTRYELLNAIENGELSRIDDPFSHIYYQQPEPNSKREFIRDKNYELINPIVTNSKCLFPRERSRVIEQIIASKKTTKQTLYRLVRQYWKRGQVPNALLPDYANSGAKGKNRVASENKLGRPRKISPGIGAIVDSEVERLFRIAIEKYYLISKGKTFSETHNRFKGMYHNYHPEIQESEIPSIWQMKHFFKKEYAQVDNLKKRTNKIIYNKDIRPLNSTVNTQVIGPGSRFEIDATIADLYLVSTSSRRNIVGRPIIYLVIDVFSRMIVGFYIGFENPSYIAAIQALSTAMTDKVKLCQKYGIDIETDDWPCVGVPDAILADRGELLGYQVESLERNFSIRIENTPPFRGDCKGIVERYFKTIQIPYKQSAPGVVTGTKIKKHGDSDYRLDAVMNIDEFTSIILALIICHNRYHTYETYDRDIDMPTDLPMTPISLWNWGLQNRSGRLRVVPEAALRACLLPRTQASISDNGVNVFGVYYTCSEIIQLGWLHRASTISRPKSCEVGYDPAIADVVYLFPNKNSSEYWTCELTDRSREFMGCSFWDVWAIKKQQKKTTANSKLSEDREKRKLYDFIDTKIANAIAESNDNLPMSNKKRISSIKDNRSLEKNKERQNAEPIVRPTQNAKTVDIVTISPNAEFPDHIDELFEDD